MTQNTHYDLLVIGAGSGGVRASRMAKTVNPDLRVAVIEEALMGGTCVNVGCVPKKLFTYAGNFSHYFKDAVGFGWDKATPSFNWNTLLKNKDAEISRLNGIYNNLLSNSGVDVIDGRARFSSDTSVVVNGTTYTADKILIACGSTPFIPDIEGKELASTSFDAFFIEKMPKKVIVVGGGYIAVEFASIFQNLGASVTQIIRKELPLTGFDTDTAKFLKTEMTKNGVSFVTGASPVKLEKNNDVTLCTLDNGTTLEADFVLFATGRRPFTNNLGLETTNVTVNKDSSIPVDENFKTNVDSIYALGDVINRMQLTPVALNEAMVFLNRVFGDKTKTMTYDNIPTAVFSYPNVGTCGLSEEEAIANGYDIAVYKSDFRPMKATLSSSDIRSFMKLIVDKKTDIVVGAHMVGDEAGEIMQGVGIAMKAKLTKADFDATIGIHPTSAEEFVTMRTPSN